MSGDLFKVQFVRFKTSFLYIPDKWIKKLKDIRKLDHESTIKVVYDTTKSAFFTWQQTVSQHDNVVGINATVASNLGLKEGDVISLVICSNPPHLHRVEMSPLSFDDLEMIEMSSGLLQSTLLNQVRVVWRGQLLTAWISSSVPIVLHVGSMDPDVVVGHLEQMTEVVIGDPISSNVTSLANNYLERGNMINDIASSGLNFASSVIKSIKRPSNSEDEKPLECKLSTEKKQYIFRVHPLGCDQSQFGPLDAFIPDSSMMNIFKVGKTNPESIFCQIKKIQYLTDANAKTNKLAEEGEKENCEQRTIEDLSTYVRLRSVTALEEAKDKYYSTDMRCIYLSNNLRNILSLEIGSRVILSDFNLKPLGGSFERIDIFPFYGLKCSELDKSLIKYIEKVRGGLLLCNNMLLTIPTENGYVDVELRFVPTSLSYYLVLPGQLDTKKIRTRLEKRSDKKLSLPHGKPFITKNGTEDLYLNHFLTNINEVLMTLNLTLGLEGGMKDQPLVRIKNNLLILGKSGAGKTSTASLICSILQGFPHHVHNAIIKCRPLKGKTVESLVKHIVSFIDDCVYHQPSILILDDLECIAGVPEDQDQNSQASSYFKRVGRMLIQLLSCLQSSHSVAIIATAPAVSSISPSVLPPRGVHFFNTRLELPELTKSDRQGVLEKLIHKKLSNKEVRELRCLDNIEDYAKKTEGYCCQDLADLVDKATLSACMRQVLSSKVPVLESCDMLQAVSESTPMLLRGVSLHKDSSLGWDDIGGLVDVKNELKEVFEWPVMYPELFQNSPLRQQSGLLLYGAPGTGKTMLAAAVASECGLNFISVKGPELLSKYIGASEEAVRNIFFKAQSAKPCVLFFDEFDSLAPRRGHDNTGVTDRVVNQLLTQLDGVESLTGVWVLAATSRPDLLDPALLRPGRLDRSVLCPLPDKEDRLAILMALSRKMNLDDDVDFTDIATQTEGFTGADLQSILYTAQLSAVEEQQSEMQGTAAFSQEEKHTPDRNTVLLKVTKFQLDSACKSTRPSLTIQERMKYQNIYKKFRAGREDNKSNILEGPPRATLA